jgi:hypothetical protein
MTNSASRLDVIQLPRKNPIQFVGRGCARIIE